MMTGGGKSALIKAAQAVLANARPLTPQQIEARKMRLEDFVKLMWSIVEPSTPLVWSWHLSALCLHLEALFADRLGVNRLDINVPPGSMKSTIVSVMLLPWIWINRPEFRAIFASGNANVSSRDSMKGRTILDSGLYRSTFGIQWQFAADQNLKTSYRNSMTGFRMAITVGAKITGDRADALFIDDSLEASGAWSKAERDEVIQWFTMRFGNRLNDMRSGKIVNIAQRLHSEDLSGWIQANEPTLWCRLVIPQVWSEAARISTPIWTDPRIEDGALMFPERFPAEIIAAERNRLGSSGFAGQHLQQPSAAEGEVFKRGYLQFWPDGKELPKFTQVIQSWDCAFKAGQQNDYSVGFEMATFDGGVMLLNCLRSKMTYPDLKARAAAWGDITKPAAVLIEDAASGQSLIQELRSSTSLPIVPVRVDGDKLVRAHSIVPQWEAQRVFVRLGAPWLTDFLDELHAFPKAPHDDMVDAFSQGLRYLTQGTGGALIDWYRTQSAASAAPAVTDGTEPLQQKKRLFFQDPNLSISSIQ